MKIPLLFFGCLLVAFGEHAVVARYSNNWEQNLSADLAQMQQKMQADAQRIQQEAAAYQKYMQAQAHKMQQQAEARQNQFNAQLQDIKQKCTKKESSNAISHNKQSKGNVSHMVQMVNGVYHIYEQTIDPATNKADGRYYSFDSKNPYAEPICGQLTIN